GCTSHDIVQQCRRIFRQKKIGHCGTLDPSATGLLLLTLGKATRLTRFLIRAPKVYEGEVHFGIETDTYDASGEKVAEKPTSGLTEADIADTMATFEGEIQQAPPRYSAKKIHGQKYYELARRGEEVPVETKTVTVYEFLPTGPLVDDRIHFRLGCASGTYARSLAHDLGQALGCGAHLSSLRRLQVGPFKVGASLTVEAIEERFRAAAAGSAPPDLAEAWIPFDEIPMPFPEVVADAVQEGRLRNGQTILVRDLQGEEGDWVKLLSQRRQFIAIGSVVERIGNRGVGVVQPKVVFHDGP
ncbi:MAG: tRNA pseudouridine(55) synthase TruB, partial [Acidobacteria bacterium]|nr:tRNA pseudouridine(55) synthase TruB [Acidobacteriota bacterium]